MKYNPDIHHRRSIRLKGYDYSQAGLYFITICTRNRFPILGEIVGAGSKPVPDTRVGAGSKPAQMVLNNVGMMVETVWNEIGPRYPGIDTDAFMVMPNHVHGIVIV